MYCRYNKNSKRTTNKAAWKTRTSHSMKEELSRSKSGVETVSYKTFSIGNNTVSGKVGERSGFEPVRGTFTVYSLLSYTGYHLKWRRVLRGRVRGHGGVLRRWWSVKIQSYRFYAQILSYPKTDSLYKDIQTWEMLMLLPLLPHNAIIIGALVLSNSDRQALPACSLITCRKET